MFYSSKIYKITSDVVAVDMANSETALNPRKDLLDPWTVKYIQRHPTNGGHLHTRGKIESCVHFNLDLLHFSRRRRRFLKNLFVILPMKLEVALKVAGFIVFQHIIANFTFRRSIIPELELVSDYFGFRAHTAGPFDTGSRRGSHLSSLTVNLDLIKNGVLTRVYFDPLEHKVRVL